MNEIRAYLNTIHPMSDEDWSYFSAKLIAKKISRNAKLIEVGEVEQHLTFISKGIVRFCIPQDENELTFGFVFENEFVTAFDSFITQLPCPYQIEALTDLSIWRISNNQLNEVYNNTPYGNFIGRKMAEKMYLIKSKRELAFLSKTAEQRYLDLFSERPELIKKIPLKFIASYIGVTPQALSRIRRRIT